MVDRRFANIEAELRDFKVEVRETFKVVLQSLQAINERLDRFEYKK